jgi:hypothetical protein
MTKHSTFVQSEVVCILLCITLLYEDIRIEFCPTITIRIHFFGTLIELAQWLYDTGVVIQMLRLEL